MAALDGMGGRGGMDRMQMFARTIIRHPAPIVAMTFLVCAAAYLVHRAEAVL